MKEVTLQSVKIKNFLSIGHTPVCIDIRPGVHFIIGDNKDIEDGKNGVGKSTIGDAIYFAFFGVPLRPISTTSIANWKNKTTGEVSVTFTVTESGTPTKYEIIRTTNPSKVQLWKDGENISRTISKTNSMIVKIIGTTPEMFEQSIILCINQTQPFMSKKKISKRKFIEGVFKLDVFSEMLSIIRHEQNNVKRDQKYDQARAQELVNALKVYRDQQEEHITGRRNRIEELQNRKVYNLKTIAQLESESQDNLGDEITALFAQVEEYKEQLQSHKASLETIRAEKMKYHGEEQAILSKLTELQDVGDEICSRCRRPFDEEHKQHHAVMVETLNKELLDIQDKLIDVDANLKLEETGQTTVRRAIDSVIDEIHQLEIAQKETEKIRQNIDQCRAWNSQIDIDIAELESYNDTYSAIITESTERLNIVQKQIDDYQERLDLMEVARFVVSEDGVKSFIVKKMLKMLNSRLSYYLQRLDANCACEFNEYFEETIVNKKGVECSYFNFSGGERKRIDLAILFTFLDIRRTQSNVSFNFTIYDELLDSSLDAIGITKVLDILKDRVEDYNEAIYIISHTTEAIKHVTGEVIYLEKRNEVTTRKPYEPIT